MGSEGDLYQDMLDIEADNPPMPVGPIIDLIFPETKALRMKIEEGIGDYGRAIADVNARIAETQGERDRRLAVTKEEGIMSLKEQGAQVAFEGRMAMTQAEMVASSEEARLGASGVRAKGSPLLAAQQNVDLAFAAADRTIERGSAGMAFGGVRLKNIFSGIGAEETLLTKAYGRRQKELQFKKRELEENKQKMLDLAMVGSITDFAGSFYKFAASAGLF